MTPAEKLRARLAAHANKINAAPVASGNPVAAQATTNSGSVASSDPQTPAGNVPVVENGASTQAPAVSVIAEIQSTDLALVERPESAGDEEEELATDLDLSNPVHAEFVSRLNKLDAALAARDPSMPLHLLEIHKALISYDEITPLLRPEEIGRIMAAQQEHVAVVLRQEVTGKAKSSATRAAGKLSLNDI